MLRQPGARHLASHPGQKALWYDALLLSAPHTVSAFALLLRRGGGMKLMRVQSSASLWLVWKRLCRRLGAVMVRACSPPTASPPSLASPCARYVPLRSVSLSGATVYGHRD